MLSTAAERKLFSGAAYAATPAIAAYNDTIIGAPELRLDARHSGLVLSRALLPEPARYRLVQTGLRP